MTPESNKFPPILANADVAPCLSVVIPMFNEQATIKDIVRIVCAQRPVEEVIIVDDCSTDGSSAIVDQIAAGNPGIRVVHQPVEQGPGHSAVPRRADRPFVEAANWCSTRMIRRRDGWRPIQTTSGPLSLNG